MHRQLSFAFYLVKQSPEFIDFIAETVIKPIIIISEETNAVIEKNDRTELDIFELENDENVEILSKSLNAITEFYLTERKLHALQREYDLLQKKLLTKGLIPNHS